MKKETTVRIYPVTYDEVCDHLRVEMGDDDKLINRLIKSATKLAEDYIEKDIAYKAHTVIGTTDEEGIITFENVTNFIEIEDFKIEGIEHTNYNFNYDDHTLIIDAELSGDFELIYTTGYIYNFDESIRTAIFIKIGELYDVDRSNYTLSNQRISNNFERILNYHKRVYFR
ncbi:MAG: head-tail connector protein [bacterium]